MNKGVRAYFTVEAVMVLPIVLGAIGVILYLLLYEYDRCILEQDMGMLSVRVSSYTLAQEDLAEEFQRLQKGLAQEKYLMCTVETPQLEVKPGRVTVSGELRQQLWPGWGDEAEEDWLRATYENYRLSPLFVIRSCEKVKNIWRKGEE